MSNIFSIPHILIMNIAGHALDSYLFIYLVNHFFPTRSGKKVPAAYTLTITLLMAATLFLVDLLSENNFYYYYITMLLLPLLYSMILFQDRLINKIAICSVFTALILSFENLILAIPAARITDSIPLLTFWFFVRRIALKLVLFGIINSLFIWPRKSNIKLPTSCWLIIFGMSLGDNLILTFFHPEEGVSHLTLMLIRSYLVLVPISLLLVVKHLSVSADKSKIMSVQMELSKIQNQHLKQQIEMMESLRKFRHDYKSHLFGIDALLSAKKYEELHQYLLSLHQYQYEGIHLRHFTDDEGVNIILNQKITLAEQLGIRFECEVVLPETGKVMINDLISLIVNLCDNAIEACATIPDARIALDIHKSKAYLIVEITNSCTENVLKANPFFQTTKKEKSMHGLGIQIIKSITAKYDGQYQVSATDDSFTTNIMLLDE